MADAPALELEAARRLFAEVIERRTFSPKFPMEVTFRPGAVLEATAIHCHWRLAENGPYSREITVQIASGAMNRFRQADAGARQKMLERLLRTFRICLMEGGYIERDSTAPAFVVSIDEHSLDD